MTQDEVIEMACQAFGGLIKKEERDNFVAFANLVAAKATEEANARDRIMFGSRDDWVLAEREACAKVVDDIELRCVVEDVDDPPLKQVAAAIRARGQA
jgi:hypothetical protein